MTRVYYNEIDPYCVRWLHNLILEGVIASGDVDDRSIEDVTPADLKGYSQCHFFAGIGVWSYTLRLAGWSDDRPIWTGSCPCQPFSAAGKRGGAADERHLWPAWYHLIEICRPATVFGEQVASKDGLAWLDIVSADLESEGYAVGAIDLCAAGVEAPHIRQRLWFVADSDGSDASAERQQHGRELRQQPANGGPVRLAITESEQHDRRRDARTGRGEPTDGSSLVNAESEQTRIPGRPWFPRGADSADWIECTDGKWRPVEPGTFPLAHGVAARMGRLRAYGNAIVAPLAAEFVKAYMDCRPT